MAIPNTLRDKLITEFRHRLCQELDVIPFVHQADWWVTTDGYELSDVVLPEGDTDRPSTLVRTPTDAVERRLLLPRPEGRAKVVALLGAYKSGKSWSAGLWAASFAAIPEAKVYLVGNVYDMCAPEFEYIVEFLLSDRGLGLKPKTLQNRPKDGRMWLELQNGARFEARSWESSESLKGKEVDGYVYCLDLDAPVWMGDYSFKPIRDIRTGDEVIGWKRREGEDCAWLREGVPSARKRSYKQDKLHRAKVLAVHDKVDKLQRVTLSDGHVITATPDHKWLVAERSDGRGNYAYRAIQVGDTICRVLDEPPPIPPELREDAAWLAGMYDGEGSRFSIAQSEKHNPALCRRIEATLQRLGFNYGVSQAGSDVNYYNIQGGKQEMLRFLHWIPSTRFREKFADRLLLSSRFRRLVQVAAIDPLPGTHHVRCLTTTTGNFVAYSTASSNCEAYQLPGIECFTSVRQNLRARSGYAIFPTTPDRPWVSVLHQNGHGEEPLWVCKCNVSSRANPITFDQAVMDSDRKLMTREKFQIAHEGQLGNYIGSVFDYQRGTREFTLSSHPDLWHNVNGTPTRENFKLPNGWKVVIGADTGTFMAATFIAISPNGDAFILDELANFTYIANVPETDPAMSVMGWAEAFKRKAALYKARPVAWVDSNSQFKVELAHYGIGLMSNMRGREVRTEAARQYFQHNKVFLAPWLRLLPYELENARWPDRTTTSGRFERMKENDHVLDGMEHVFSRHPRAPKRRESTTPVIPGVTQVPVKRKRRPNTGYDPHLGGM